MEPQLRPDCRRVICDLCRRVGYLCSWCDRGQRYCSRDCGAQARRDRQREAGERYQHTPQGRRRHARRQALYRLRQQAAREKVTHQGCPPETGSGRVLGCKPTRFHLAPESGVPHSPLPPPVLVTAELLCFVCGLPCEALVREDFRRCRRGRGLSIRSQDDDRARSRDRDPPFVHR